jgi:hypothetical protein
MGERKIEELAKVGTEAKMGVGGRQGLSEDEKPKSGAREECCARVEVGGIWSKPAI